MASFLLLAGAKGKRYALPNSEVMIHQPSGGAQGQATDIAISAKRILQTRETINRLMSKHTGMSIEQIDQDVERDHFMSAQEALEYGIIDRIITTAPEL